MSNRNRFSLFIAVNLLVPFAFFITLNLLDICLYSVSDEIDYNALTVFCLLSAMGITLLTLALSKAIPKRMTGIRVIKPSQTSSSGTICQIILACNGETDWNAKEKKEKWSDISLNETGRIQTKALAEDLSHIPVKAIYAASETRSIETAKILAGPHEESLIASDPALQFSKKKYKFLFFFLPRQYKKKRLYREITQNATTYFQKMAYQHPGETIFAVTHRRAIRYLLRSLGESSSAIESGGAACIASDGKTLWVTEIKKEKLIKNKEINNECKLVKTLASSKKHIVSASSKHEISEVSVR
jgi:broad specificity phosphatase PhoE